MASLSTATIQRIHNRLVTLLAQAQLDVPTNEQDEDSYTGSVLAPMVREYLATLRPYGILVAGHHTGINRPVTFQGGSFTPDLAIMYREAHITAIEVKIIPATPVDRSGILSKAIGQASIYRLRYKHAAALILDASKRSSSSRSRPPTAGTAHGCSLSLIWRRKRGNALAEGSVYLVP